MKLFKTPAFFKKIPSRGHYILLVNFVLGTSLSVQAQVTKSVLFLGNSYTYTHNVPNTIKLLAASNGDQLVYDVNAPGAYTLSAHATNATSISKIKNTNWDHVILQEQSTTPSNHFKGFYKGVTNLNQLIREKSPCINKTILYMTWGRPNKAIYTTMQQRLTDNYNKVARAFGNKVSPVGVAWKKVRDDGDPVNLYAGDSGGHQSFAGTYLAACVLYATIFNKTPVGLSYTGALSTADATYLQTKALEAYEEYVLANLIHVGPAEDAIKDLHRIAVNYSKTQSLICKKTYAVDFNYTGVSPKSELNATVKYVISEQGSGKTLKEEEIPISMTVPQNTCIDKTTTHFFEVDLSEYRKVIDFKLEVYANGVLIDTETYLKGEDEYHVFMDHTERVLNELVEPCCLNTSFYLAYIGSNAASEVKATLTYIIYQNGHEVNNEAIPISTTITPNVCNSIAKKHLLKMDLTKVKPGRFRVDILLNNKQVETYNLEKKAAITPTVYKVKLHHNESELNALVMPDCLNTAFDFTYSGKSTQPEVTASLKYLIHQNGSLLKTEAIPISLTVTPHTQVNQTITRPLKMDLTNVKEGVFKVEIQLNDKLVEIYNLEKKAATIPAVYKVKLHHNESELNALVMPDCLNTAFDFTYSGKSTQPEVTASLKYLIHQNGSLVKTEAIPISLTVTPHIQVNQTITKTLKIDLTNIKEGGFKVEIQLNDKLVETYNLEKKAATIPAVYKVKLHHNESELNALVMPDCLNTAFDFTYSGKSTQPEVTASLKYLIHQNGSLVKTETVPISLTVTPHIQVNQTITRPLKMDLTNIKEGGFRVEILLNDKLVETYNLTKVVASISEPDLKNEIVLFPIPLQSQLNIHLPKKYQQVHTEVYSLTGKCVHEKKITHKKDISLNLSHLPAGKYLLKLHINHQLVVKKVVKK